MERNFAYSPEAVTLWQVLRNTVIEPLAAWLPKRLQPLGRKAAAAALPALLTPHMRKAFGVAEPSWALRLAVDTALKVRAAYVRRQPPRVAAAYPDPLPTPSFPTGEFRMEELGPEHTTGRRTG
ncbi:Peptidase OS=Streptomyces fumanus OX=67302 GN=GCM10018772_37100 PE=4 SV=1 [Streptomyces fumanus]